MTMLSANGKVLKVVGQVFVNYVTPEKYGAVGDGSTDDTAAFDAMFADTNAHTMILPPNKTYKVQFKNWTIRNRTFIGSNKMTSRITQANTNINTPFMTPGTGCNIGNMCFICGGGNTVRTGLFHFGNDANGTFQPFIGTILHDIYAYCVNNIIGVDISYSQSGSYNLKIEHCKFDSPGIGIRISNLNDLIHQNYISNFYFEDISVKDPYDYGYEFDKAQAGGMMISHGVLIGCSTQLSRANSCGFKLTYGEFVLINPMVFLENSSGTCYSLELDFNKLYVAVALNGVISCFGGILEGVIKNKEFLNFIDWHNVDFVEELGFYEGTDGKRLYSRHLNSSPNTLLFSSRDDLFDTATFSNCSGVKENGLLGRIISLSISDFLQSIFTLDIEITLPAVDKFSTCLLFKFENGFKLLTTASQTLPSAVLVDSDNNEITDFLGPDNSGRKGRITMDDYGNYYSLQNTFDISEADRAKTWKLRFNFPTNYTDGGENAKTEILALNFFENFVKNVNLNVEMIRPRNW